MYTGLTVMFAFVMLEISIEGIDSVVVLVS